MLQIDEETGNRFLLEFENNKWVYRYFFFEKRWRAYYLKEYHRPFLEHRPGTSIAYKGQLLTKEEFFAELL